MKEIEIFTPEKYSSAKYELIAKDIYKVTDAENELFVTSVSFVQEPEFGESENNEDISEHPLEDLLDEYFCFISDFYSDLNGEGSNKCYLEFAAPDLNDIKSLHDIIGKHVYAIFDGDDVNLVIE